MTTPCSVHTILNMEKRQKVLQAAFVEATELARPNLEKIADAIGRSYRTLMFYRSGERQVTREAALRLADFLRERSDLLRDRADELERLAGGPEHGGDDGE